MSYERPRTLPGEILVPDGRVLPVRLTNLRANRAFVEGLSGHVIRAGTDVLLRVDDGEVPITVEGRLDWIANRSGIRLYRRSADSLARLHWVMAALERSAGAGEDDEQQVG